MILNLFVMGDGWCTFLTSYFIGSAEDTDLSVTNEFGAQKVVFVDTSQELTQTMGTIWYMYIYMWYYYRIVANKSVVFYPSDSFYF